MMEVYCGNSGNSFSNYKYDWKSEDFIPFDRYNNGIRFFSLSNLKRLPADFNTTEEEIIWYVRSLGAAQMKYRAFTSKVKQWVAFTPLGILIAAFIILGVLSAWELIELDFSMYVTIYLFISWACVLWAWCMYKSPILDRLLNIFYIEDFFPPEMPNVDRFLSYCLMDYMKENTNKNDI